MSTRTPSRAGPGRHLQRLASRKCLALPCAPMHLVVACAAIGAGLVASLGAGRGAWVGGLCGAGAPWLVLRVAPDRRDARVGAQVPELLDAVGRSLRAGRSLVGAVGVAVSEAREPLATELRPIWMRVEAGVGLRDSLATAGEAGTNGALRTALAALAIANEAGGAQAMVFDALASSLRSRAVVGRELRALATPVRVSATLIGLAPPVVLAAVAAIDPTTASQAYASSAGRAAAALGVALDAAGLFWIRRLTRFAP